MTRTCVQVRNDVIGILGDSGQVIMTDARLLPWINQAQMDIARKTDCIQATTSWNSVVAQGAYALPAAFLKADRVTYDNVPLLKTTIREIDTYNPARDTGTNTGAPEYFYIYGGNLYLEPFPQAAGTNNIDMQYIKSPALLTAVGSDNLEIPDKFYDDVVRYVIMRAREYTEQFEVAGRMQQELDSRMQEVKFDVDNVNSDTYPSIRDYDTEWWG